MPSLDEELIVFRSDGCATAADVARELGVSVAAAERVLEELRVPLLAAVARVARCAAAGAEIARSAVG